jgi:class 3 adenylate cyclase
VELGVGPIQARQHGAPVTIPGAKPRAILTMLGLHVGSVVSADTLVELLWGEDPPRTAAKALQTHISSLRRTLGDGFVLTEGSGWTLAESEVDTSRYKAAARLGRDAAAAGDISQALARFEEALALWRGIPELPDGRRGTSEKTRWAEGHAALVEDRADALLATGRAAEIIGELEAAVADAPLRERRWGQLMLALYRAGRQGEALGAYQRARTLLADELGVDPGPDLRRLEVAIVAQDTALEIPAAQQSPTMTRAVTFLLTDIEGSTAAWEADAAAMAAALARHDELVEQVVTSRGGRLIKTRGEGDATFSVFDRPSAAAAAAIEVQEAIISEPWALREPLRIRVAVHTGEVEFRDGDYFGRAVNRAARLRSLAVGGQILCSGATAELVIDSLPDDVVLDDLGMRQLRNLARPEHVFELRLETGDDRHQPDATDAPIERPSLPAVLAGPGPFVGRGLELERLLSAWQTALAGGMQAVLIAGEPGVGKTRLAGEWSRQAYDQGAVVIYGRCDEDLGAPYQPFAEALRSLVPCLGTSRLRALRGAEALLPLVPGLTDVLPDLAAPTRADPDTERYALFDAVVALLGLASAGAPVILILDDLHWAAKPTLLLLRHLLRFGEHARVQVVGTYRSTDLDRSHPLAAMLADLHRDGIANRIQLSGLDEGDVTTYVVEAGYDDEELARALASVTGGNPFFLIEALRHVDESGGHWDPSTLPQGVREAVSRRLTRLPAETNKALAAAAVVGSRFGLELVERVVGDDLVDALDEACKAGIIIEESSGHYRFNHAIVRQSLLAELPSVRRLRLHQRIATTLETEPGADDELLAELAYHYFECAWAGNAVKAVEYCRRAADQAMARLAYEGAADLYDHALHALEEIDDELPDREDQVAELLVAHCEALLAAGDVASAAGAVPQLQAATTDSARRAAWATCFDGQLSMLIHPERLDEVEAAVGAAAGKLAVLDDAAGEAKAHTVRAACLARLGRIGDCEIALDDALTAARRGREHRAVNAVLAGAPLAALWGPNPVPRAGGRCLDVVRLLRITTDSPAVEATSTRCQAVLEAFRGRAAAARRMIDSARRTVTELGLRHALLEVEQFAGIVELVGDDPAAAEPHLRKAYNGFRRMGLDADTAETAALLGRTCLALDRDAEAVELCTESERLAGHALKPSIAWRTLRAHLLSRGNDHDEARRVAEAAVTLAERTDLLVDHGDACASLATVLGAAGDAAGARAAAERAVGLYERKGAAALAEKARDILGAGRPAAPAPPEPPAQVKPDTACGRAIGRLDSAVDREAWDEVEQQFASDVRVESRRKIVGYPRVDLSPRGWIREVQRARELGMVRQRHAVVAVRGDRLALTRLEVGTADVSPGAPQDEMLRLIGLDEGGRIALLLWFDVEDIDTALAELDAAHARFEGEQPQARRLENAASRADDRFNKLFADRRWDEIDTLLTDDVQVDDRRRGLRRDGDDHDTEVANARAIADIGAKNMTSQVLAIRGERLVLTRTVFSGRDQRPEAFHTEILRIAEIDTDERIVAYVAFDLDHVDAAYEELEARYLAGEAAPYSHVWQIGMETVGELNRHEPGRMIAELVYTDHRHVPFAPGDFGRAVEELWALVPDARYRTTVVYALDTHGTVVKFVIEGTDIHGSELHWPRVLLLSVGREESRLEVYEEDDVDTALARFEELRPQARRLENTASQVSERHSAHFAARDWDALAKVLGDDILTDDRRRAVNAGIRRGRDAEIANLQAAAEVGLTYTAFVVIAARGERLILTRASVGGGGSAEFTADALSVVEINSHNQIAAIVIFELDDFDAAIAELDARYLVGEAAAHPGTWSVITGTFASLSQNELPALTPDCVTIDHRRVTAFAPGEMTAYIRAGFEIDQTIRAYVEVVHRLSDLGAVCIYAAHGVSREGFDGEWRGVNLATVDGDMVNRSELFDETDVDAAIATFDQLSRPATRLENTASQVTERFLAYFAVRDWDAMSQILGDDFSYDDRRPVVGSGVRPGGDAHVADMRASADLWTANVTPTVMATRGERLVLAHLRFPGRDQGPEAFVTDVLGIIEISADERMVSFVSFELDDFDAAITELDALYLAGEAAAHAGTWSVIAAVFVAHNRREVAATTPDVVTIDHRRAAAFAPGQGIEYIRAGWDLDQNVNIYIETAHRANDLGAVFTWAGYGTSHEGFEAEWRGVNLMTVDGEMVDRSEVFDEAGLDDALARFDQLSRPTPQLVNAASQVCERFRASFAARDWDVVAEMAAEDFSIDDRRRVVNAGVRLGRDAWMEDLRASADLGVACFTAVVIATRGERLVLIRGDARNDERPEAFQFDVLQVVEIDADERIAAAVTLDLNDIDAAFAELEARYLAGDAAAHAHTWSLIAGAYAAINRHEIATTTPDFVNIDHRRGVAYAPGDLISYIRAGWDLGQNIRTYIEAVHRLDNLGAVVTHAAHGTSHEGFDAEWRGVQILTVDGDLGNRSELFDEADLDTAIARFEELHPPTPRLGNAASQVAQRFWSCFVARDWDTMAALIADDVATEDRRRVVSAGSWHGRDFDIASMRAAADIGASNATLTVIATRGNRLALSRVRVSGRDQRPEAFHTEALGIAEIDADGGLVAHVAFDPDDIDAAFAELDARYLAGEAAAHAHFWSVITNGYATLNNHELPAWTSDWVTIDHRLRATFEAADQIAYIRGAWDLTPNLKMYIEAVHRLSGLGAVVTHAAYGSTQEGFNAEWRMIELLAAGDAGISRCELFDETDLDTALARFDELHTQATRLENAASQHSDRYLARCMEGDWDAIAEMLAHDYYTDDRRRVVGGGIHGRDVEIENLRAGLDLGVTNATSDTIATRGERLVLTHVRYWFDGQRPEAFLVDILAVLEINADNRSAAAVTFELDDIDAAFAELDARYLAAEAAAHAQTWSVIMQAYAAANRHELAATSPNLVNIDHRRLALIESGDLAAYLRNTFDDLTDLSTYLEAVHRLTDRGAVVTHVGTGTSQEDFDAAWRMVSLIVVEDNLISRCEIFDEVDLDAAIARFDELHQQATRLGNAASRVDDRFGACFRTRDWVAMTEILADDTFLDDRRRVVGIGIRQGQDVQIADFRAAAYRDITPGTESGVATRGQRLALRHLHVPDRDQRPEAFHSELLYIVEIDTDERIVARVLFDVDDVDAAFKDLDARYLAGEATDHAHTWSAVTGVYAALNRHEHPALTQDSVCIDRRPLVPIETVDLATWIRGVWDVTPGLSNYIETVHRLSNFGAVLTHAARGNSQVGFGAEWRFIAVLMFEDDRIGRLELFDEADIYAALARFEELRPQAPPLENAASRVTERFRAFFAARDWDAMTEMLAEDFCNDDRRRIVNSGIRRGRDVGVEDLRAAVDVIDLTYATSVVTATRGDRLELLSARVGNGGRPEAFQFDVLQISEIDADGRIATVVTFDLDDIDAAFAELDNRYLAGEAAAHAHAWSLIAGLYAVLNRHELPPTTPDFVDVDHRRLAPFAQGDIIEFARTAFDQIPDLSFRIEAVHGLSNLGGVVTQVLRGTSREGFEAEWREIHLMTVEGDMFSRSEIFDETDVDAAVARFDELQPQARRLENAASQLTERCWTFFAAGEWDAMAEILAADYISDDRRRLLNAGIRHGRDAEIENLRAAADVGFKHATSAVVATRGKSLALSRMYSSDRDQRPEPFGMELLGLTEINADNRIAAFVVFDLDDVDAAFAELDARYLADEAAAHSHTWSVIARAQAAGNRHEYPPTTPDSVYIDHRPVVRIEAVDIAASLRAMWDLAPEVSFHIEAVDRLSEFGAVVTQILKGTSQEGFDAEWRTIDIFTVEGDLISRCEVFDEADIDAALARFDQLNRPVPQLENAATRVYECLQAYFAAREWDAMAEILADDHYSDDRRRAVNAGIRRGQDVQIANMQTAVGLGTTSITSNVIATRGERLALRRVRFSGRDQRPEAFHTETLGIVEIDADERIAALVTFDLDDMDAAFEELDARYLAGEPAAHSHAWSVIARECAAFNRHEVTAVDYIAVDHRLLPLVEADSQAGLQVWEVTPDFSIHIEAVHRLSSFGAVATYTAYGTSREGFGAEWRPILLTTVEGDRINCCEVFDETDLDAALARFEELQPHAPRLENTASQIIERYQACFTARDWAAFAELLADEIVTDDRRRVVNAGVRRGRDVHITDMRTAVEVGAETMSSRVIATRGDRLALAHVRSFNRGMFGEVAAELLGIAQIDADERLVAIVSFDLDNIDAAYEELDARYLGGEAAAHSQTWSVIARTYAAINRHEILPTAPDWINVDHRRLARVTIQTDDLTTYLRTAWDLTPDLTIHVEAVHRLSGRGAVVTHAAHGRSPEGFEAEWRMVEVLTLEGGLINRCELFDEADLDAALARFAELQPLARPLENAATQVAERLQANFAVRDWTARAELLAEDCSVDDRRRVVNAGIQRGRDADIANMRAIAAVGVANIALTTIATRGERLALSRARMSGRDQRPEAFYTETLAILEIDTNNRAVAQVVFDPDDIDAALAELDARYLAGEAVPHAHTWSVIAGAYAATNRRELPQTTQDWVSIDHRRAIAFAPGELIPDIQATWDIAPDINSYAEAAHRLSNLGAVVTQVVRGTSQQGSEGEWREIVVVTVEGDLINRIEMFEEADLDAALAKFDELGRPTPLVENAATRVYARLNGHFATRDWEALTETLADDHYTDDRRRVVGGIRHTRDTEIRSIQATADLGVTDFAWAAIATRGTRLALCRTRGATPGPEAFDVELLQVVEIDTDERVASLVTFDLDDIDAAIAELDARYRAGEAAPHARTWSVIAGTYAGFNRQELPATTPDCVNIDHRPLGRTIDASDLRESFRATWLLTPEVSAHVEAVHRLNDLGAVVTHAARGTSQQGFDAEWRMIYVVTVEGELISRYEIFDEADLEAALARFDELDPQPPRLENAATQVEQLSCKSDIA